MLELVLQTLRDCVAIGASAAAVFFDLRARRIPNRLTYATALAALVLAGLHAGTSGNAAILASCALGGVVLLFVFGGLSFAGLLGFGDTKLLAAIGLCVGLPMSLRIAACVLLSGGVLAVLHAVRAGLLRNVLANLARPNRLRSAPISEPQPHLHLFGYAVAIALGTCWALLGRQYPSLLPL